MNERQNIGSTNQIADFKKCVCYYEVCHMIVLCALIDHIYFNLGMPKRELWRTACHVNEDLRSSCPKSAMFVYCIGSYSLLKSWTGGGCSSTLSTTPKYAPVSDQLFPLPTLTSGQRYYITSCFLRNAETRKNIYCSVENHWI